MKINKIKNIGVVMDITPRSGGKQHMITSMCKYINEIKEFKFHYITTFSETKKILDKELNVKSILYKKTSFYLKFLNRLYKFFNIFLKIHPFEKFIIKNQINAIIFLDPSPLVMGIKKTPFIYPIFDIDYRKLGDLPEFKRKEINLREKCHLYACKNCSKLIVGHPGLKKEISTIYNIEPKKVVDIIFPPVITKLNYEKNEINKDFFFKLTKFKNYLLYPAQFWKHKNHEYIIKSFKNLSQSNLNNLNMIFTGDDKGNLLNIKNLINKFDLNKNFYIFNYVSNEELCELYKNCKGVIIPTKVGLHTFPLYEAFYFKKPVIYNVDNLDSSLKDKVIKLDISDTTHLEKLIPILNEVNYIKQLTHKNREYYDSLFTEKKYNKILLELFNNF